MKLDPDFEKSLNARYTWKVLFKKNTYAPSFLMWMEASWFAMLDKIGEYLEKR